MPDSVAAAQKIEEFRALAKEWAEKNPIDIDGQQFFPNIESCIEFSELLKPTIEAYEKTPYRKEWNVVQKHMSSNFRKKTLFEFKGKENHPVPLKELENVDNPFDLAHLINLELRRIARSSHPHFAWRMDYDNYQKTFTLITNPVH